MVDAAVSSIKDQLCRVEIELAVKPGTATGLDIRTLLLARMRCLFLNVTSRLARNIQTVEGATRTLCSLAILSAISANVISGVSSIRPRMKLSCGSSLERDG